jgi:tetratricopeptide (TPR) repeat protein
MGFFSSLFSPPPTGDGDQQKASLKNFDILKYDGIRALRVGKAEYAVKCFTEALKIQPDFETMTHLTSACYTLNRLDQALEVLNAMVDTGQQPTNTLLMRAGLLYTMGANAEAVADCIQAAALEPNNQLAYFQLARSEYAVGKPHEAIDNLNRAIALKAGFAEAIALRAHINYALERGNDALADAEKLMALTPEDETACLLRGRIRELLGDTDAAFGDYHQALCLNPFNEEAYLLAGQCLMAQEKYPEAIALFDEAIEHNEQFTKAYAERAQAKRKTNDLEGAAADEERAGAPVR